MEIRKSIPSFYGKLSQLPLRSPYSISAEITRFWDEILKTLYTEKIGKRKEVSLLATGGFGRKEMSLYSDTDITFIALSGKELIEGFLYTLWDAGVEISYSIRTPDECIELAREDPRVKLSMFDARFLCGSVELYEETMKKFERLIYSNLDGFIQEILELKSERHRKYGDTLYIIEPHIRDTPGGIRDVHTVLWCIKALFKDEPWKSLLRYGILSRKELSTLKRHLDFLKRIRNLLHLLHMRKYDLLDFESQDRVAPLMGYSDSKDETAAERLMREYFIRTKEIHDITSFIEKEILPESLKKKTVWVELGPFYRIGGGKLTIKNPHLIMEQPHRILEMVKLCTEYEVSLGESIRKTGIEVLKGLSTNFWNVKEAKELFLEILNSKNAWFALQEMNESEILHLIIPPFKKIFRKVQRDMHHIYTVDVHTIFAIKEFETMRNGKYLEELPLATKIAQSIDKPYVVILSLLFHDIGKGIGSPHAETGAKIARKFSKILGIKEGEIIEKVIRLHMVFPEFSFKRDIYDMEFLKKTSEMISSPYILDLLYIHAICDLRAVNPSSWSEWKHSVINEFYHRLKEALTIGDFYLYIQASKVKETKENTISLLQERGLSELVEYIHGFDDEYFIPFSPEEIVSHIQLIHSSREKGFGFLKKDVPEKGYSEIIITGPDEHGIFAKLAGAISLSGLNILSAFISSRKDGKILDVFRVTEKGTFEVPRFFDWEKFSMILEGVIKGKIDLKELLKSEEKPYGRVIYTQEKVSINNELSSRFTVVEVNTADRPRLLFRIASAISELGYEIHTAKVLTLGSLASDVFYITGKNGEKIRDEKELASLKEKLGNLTLLKPPS